MVTMLTGEQWDGGLSILSSTIMPRFTPTSSCVHLEAHKLSPDQRGQTKNQFGSPQLCAPETVFKTELKSIATQVLGEGDIGPAWQSGAFYKGTVSLSWLRLTWSDQAEAWEVEPWRYVYFLREWEVEKCKKRELGREGQILGSVLLVEAGQRIVLLIGKWGNSWGRGCCTAPAHWHLGILWNWQTLLWFWIRPWDAH